MTTTTLEKVPKPTATSNAVRPAAVSLALPMATNTTTTTVASKLPSSSFLSHEDSQLLAQLAEQNQQNTIKRKTQLKASRDTYYGQHGKEANKRDWQGTISSPERMKTYQAKTLRYRAKKISKTISVANKGMEKELAKMFGPNSCKT